MKHRTVWVVQRPSISGLVVFSNQEAAEEYCDYVSKELYELDVREGEYTVYTGQGINDVELIPGKGLAHDERATDRT